MKLIDKVDSTTRRVEESQNQNQNVNFLNPTLKPRWKQVKHFNHSKSQISRRDVKRSVSSLFDNTSIDE